jgi:site-specific DNA-methyltransferase (adenine-specific)
MFTSARHDWVTPQPFYESVNAEFRFTLDAAADASNAKCDRFYSEADDALSQPWPGSVWCNPPYGRQIGAWVRKGYKEAARGSVVVMLIPSRTDTAYWHDYVMCADEVRFVRGRLVFGDGDALSNAPFPSALVVFRNVPQAPRFASIQRGRLTRRSR